jgi:hypothetical protein
MDFLVRSCDTARGVTSKGPMRRVFAFGLVGFLLSLEGIAGATPTSTLKLETDLKDAMSELDARDARPLSLELNPFMGIVAGAVSGNVEYLPLRHLGLVLSPRASVIMPAWATEIGARYWTGRRREASGFFIGPSAIYGRTRGEAIYGLAFDGGVQTIFDNGITIGAGIGVQYVEGAVGNSALEVGPLESDAKVQRAVLPRLLFSVGYSL